MSIADECESLIAQYRSLMLATVDEGGEPFVSYAPFIRGDDRAFYVFVSDLAGHTRNLRQQPNVRIMIVEDEGASSQVFARKRITFDCTVEFVPREQPAWNAIIDRFQETFGELIATLRGLADFRLVRLTPRGAVFVKGFGKAYRLEGDNFDQPVHLRRND